MMRREVGSHRERQAPETKVKRAQRTVAGDGHARKVAVAALQASVELYRTVADFTYDWETWVGPDGRYVYVSPSCERITGYRVEEFRAEPGLLARLVHPEDRERLCAHCRHPDEAPAQEAVFRVVARTGEVRWVEHICRPVYGAAGVYLGRRVSTRDITDRIRAQATLRESEERYRLLMEHSDLVIGYWSPEGTVLFMDRGSLANMRASLPDVVGKNAVEIFGDELGSMVRDRIRDAVGSRVAREYEDLSVMSSGPKWCLTVYAAVVGSGGEVQGVQTVSRDITERKRAEEELRRSKRELELAQQIALVGHWEWDIVGEKLSWSDELYRMWGVPKDFALTFASVESLIHPYDRALNSVRVREALDSADDTDYEFRIVRPDGAVRHVHQRIEVTRGQGGRALSAFGIMQDITERRQTMETLNVHAMLMDQLRDTITATDMEGRITYANRASYDMLGLENGSLVGRTVHAYGEDPRRGATQDEIIAATQSAGQWRGLVVNKGMDGRETILDLRTHVIRDERGNPTGMCGIGTDVTERTRVEEAYRSLVDNSLQGIAIIKDGRMVFCNQALSRLSGYSQEEACAMSAEQVMVTVHPDDRARVMRGMAELLAGGDVPSRQEMRLVTKDGRSRWVEVLSVRASYYGRPALQVSYLDVTGRREAEAALLRSESRYRELFRAISVGVAVYEAADEGRQFVFRELNPAAETIDGIRAEDVLGHRVTETLPRVADMGLLEVFRRVWSTGIPEHQRASYCRDDRRQGWRDSYVYRLPTGEVVAAYEDVTERKRAEEELSRRSEQLARANTMLSALGRVAALLQSSTGPDDIVLTLGAELKALGMTCVVAVLEADQQCLRVVHASIAPEALSALRGLVATAPEGYRFPRERFPAVAAAIEGRRGVFVPDPWQVGMGAVTAVPDSVREHALELGGLARGARAVVLPLAAGDQTIGVLVAWGSDLLEADLPPLTVFAEQVAVTFHDARMFEQAQAARDRLRDLARHLQSAREEERSTIAREIHDELGQIVTALKIDLRWLRKRLDPSRPELLEKTGGMVGLVDEMIEATQRLASKLRPRMLDDLGLVAAVEWLAGDHGRRTGIPCEVDVQITESRIGPDGTTALFRIIQEALSNVARHAEASHVTVRLRETGAALEASIQDDGIGIAAGSTADPHSFGLIGIRERAEGLGGQVSIRGEPGKGTSILVTVPLPAGGALP